MFQFNQTSLGLGKAFSNPQESDFPSLLFKNADLKHVLKHTTDYVRQVIDGVEICGQHKHVVVDIKVHDIVKGLYPCIPGWHCDTVVDPSHQSQPEIHNLFVSGTAALTEFIAEPINLEVEIGLEPKALLNKLQSQIAIVNPSYCKIPSCQWVQYGRYDFHRGSQGLFSERRLLIRVSETDYLRPNNRPQTFILWKK